MKYPIRHPDGQEFGPFTIEELRQQSADKAYPPNTEILANGEWVSLGGWLVVRRRVEQLQATEQARKQLAQPKTTASSPGRALPPNQKSILIGAALFLLVILLAFVLR